MRPWRGRARRAPAAGVPRAFHRDAARRQAGDRRARRGRRRERHGPSRGLPVDRRVQGRQHRHARPAQAPQRRHLQSRAWPSSGSASSTGAASARRRSTRAWTRGRARSATPRSSAPARIVLAIGDDGPVELRARARYLEGNLAFLDGELRGARSTRTTGRSCCPRARWTRAIRWGGTPPGTARSRCGASRIARTRARTLRRMPGPTRRPTRGRTRPTRPAKTGEGLRRGFGTTRATPASRQRRRRRDDGGGGSDAGQPPPPASSSAQQPPPPPRYDQEERMLDAFENAPTSSRRRRSARASTSSAGAPTNERVLRFSSILFSLALARAARAPSRSTFDPGQSGRRQGRTAAPLHRRGAERRHAARSAPGPLPGFRVRGQAQDSEQPDEHLLERRRAHLPHRARVLDPGGAKPGNCTSGRRR